MKTVHLLACAVAAALLVAAGCSSGPKIEVGVIVKGKLVQDGQVIRSKSTEPTPPGVEENALEVIFYPIGETKTDQFYADYNIEDGSFVFEGRGKGIPPGKYRLVVTQSEALAGGFDYDPGEADSRAATDMFGGAFSHAKSPFEFDVPEDKVGGELDLQTIDLAKPPG